jgi:hypothetical protein
MVLPKALSRRALVFIITRDVGEVSLAEASFSLRVRRHGLGHKRTDAAIVAALDFRRSEVAAARELRTICKVAGHGATRRQSSAQWIAHIQPLDKR